MICVASHVHMFIYTYVLYTVHVPAEGTELQQPPLSQAAGYRMVHFPLTVRTVPSA